MLLRDIWFDLDTVASPSNFVAGILLYGDVDGDGDDEFIAADMKGGLMVWKNDKQYFTDCRNLCGHLNYAAWVDAKVMGSSRRVQQDVCVLRLDGILQIWSWTVQDVPVSDMASTPASVRTATQTHAYMHLSFERSLLQDGQQLLGLTSLSAQWDAPDNFLLVAERNHVIFFPCVLTPGDGPPSTRLKLSGDGEETRRSVAPQVDGLKVLDSPLGFFLLVTQTSTVSVYRLDMDSRKDLDWSLVSVDSTRAPPLVDLSGYVGPVSVCPAPGKSSVFALASLDGRFCICSVQKQADKQVPYIWGVRMSLQAADCLFDVQFVPASASTNANASAPGHTDGYFVACAWSGCTYMLKVDDLEGGHEYAAEPRGDGGAADESQDDEDLAESGTDTSGKVGSSTVSVLCFDCGLRAGTSAVSVFCGGWLRRGSVSGSPGGDVSYDGSRLFYSTAAGTVLCVTGVRSQLTEVASPCLDPRSVSVETLESVVRLLERGGDDKRLKLVESALGLSAEALREGGTQFFFDALWALPERKMLTFIDALATGRL